MTFVSNGVYVEAHHAINLETFLVFILLNTASTDSVQTLYLWPPAAVQNRTKMHHDMNIMDPC